MDPWGSRIGLNCVSIGKAPYSDNLPVHFFCYAFARSIFIHEGKGERNALAAPLFKVISESFSRVEAYGLESFQKAKTCERARPDSGVGDSLASTGNYKYTKIQYNYHQRIHGSQRNSGKKFRDLEPVGMIRRFFGVLRRAANYSQGGSCGRWLHPKMNPSCFRACDRRWTTWFLDGSDPGGFVHMTDYGEA